MFVFFPLTGNGASAFGKFVVYSLLLVFDKILTGYFLIAPLIREIFFS